MNDILHKCPICGVFKDDICERTNHYDQEVNENPGSTMICCRDCELENMADI